jgi:hypothetical protein
MNFKPVWPGVPIAGLMPSIFLVLFGIFSDPSPPPPVGEVVGATVISPQREGRPESATLVAVESSDGPVICGIDRSEFDDRGVPTPGTRITVDYTPGDCTLAPVSDEVPRWALVVAGVGGIALMSFWLWAGGRHAPAPRLRRRPT